MNKHLEPVNAMERIQALDVLRGLSLLGILLVNMIGFHSPYGYYNPYEWWKYGDLTVYAWLDVLVQGSFYPIFAMMFGYGLVIMQRRSAIRGTSFWKISLRRLSVLLIFGIIHAFFIWYGDILITYALMGMVLLMFLRLSGPWLMALGWALYLLPQLFLSGMLVLASLFDTASLADYIDIAGLQQAEITYSSGSFMDITIQRIADWKASNLSGGLIIYLFLILPMLMIGAGAGKMQWLEKAGSQWKKWLVILLIALPVGIAVKMLPFFAGLSISFQYIQDAIGGPILGMAYVAAIVLIMRSAKAAKWLHPLSSAGRMSITIYIMQSVIGTLIFYHYGLGLYGEVSLATGTWLAFAIYIIQVIFAEIWLAKFKQGPIEKFWRFLTYGNNKKRGAVNEVNEL
ncbi:DUF418 domain-containing protein [Siminovitchia fortis]|uniref:DUF418 domain-containing protein n=1 Tax=Siminovitchia fortis TaxID=254758 RepID=A0A443J2G2_9BACI|nr:DUF418 domain-containing protein [Siminovitchia fortis]RWR14553.1 DUF418 domain-containing protein [Siminovitchia fortis]WHY83593.1 DUF418 domain-containing protein [Siminovitchia fortis]